jgi:hypothetical protein
MIVIVTTGTVVTTGSVVTASFSSMSASFSSMSASFRSMSATGVIATGTSAAPMYCSGASAIRVNMTFALETGVVKVPSVEIASVFSFKDGVIVLEIETVAVMPVPGGIGIIGIPRIIGFIDYGSRNSDAYIYVHL